MSARLNVSIVTYMTSVNELETCIASLDSDEVRNIYVVDNSRQEAIRNCCAAFQKVVYIPNPNVGFGAAHNIALRESLNDTSVKYHLVLNSDVLFEPSVLEELVRIGEGDEGIGLMQPKVTYPDGTPQYTARLLPAPVDVFARRFLPAFAFKDRNRRYTLQGFKNRKVFNAPYFQGSFLFCSVAALRECGLFDERFFMYPEDIDLCRRIGANFRLQCVNSLSIIHNHRAQSYKSWRMTWVHCVNMVRYFNKWGWFFDRRRREINKGILCQFKVQ